MRTLTKAIGLLVMAASAAPLAAQDAPFEVNLDRVKVAGGNRLGDSDTYFIPTFYLLVAAKGSAWASKGGAQAHAKWFVDGLTKEMMQDFSKKLHDDLATKIRAAGYKVLTYDDMKGDPALAEKNLMGTDEKWGMPTRKGIFESTRFVVGTPTDAQAYSFGITGPVWPFRGLAKDKQVVVLVPEIWFQAPQVSAKTEEGYKRASAGINFNPMMILESAVVWGLNPKQAGVSIIVQRHGSRHASENAGTITQLSEDKYNFSSDWKRTSGDFSFTIDPGAVAAGILRVGYALNSMIADKVREAHK